MVAEHDGEALGLEVMPDHAHLLVEVPPGSAIVAGRAAAEGPQLPPVAPVAPALWSPSWLGAPLHVVKRYVETQKRRRCRWRTATASTPTLVRRRC